MKEFNTSLYFITDSTGFDEADFLHRVEDALNGGVPFFSFVRRIRQQESILILRLRYTKLQKSITYLL